MSSTSSSILLVSSECTFHLWNNFFFTQIWKVGTSFREELVSCHITQQLFAIFSIKKLKSAVVSHCWKFSPSGTVLLLSSMPNNDIVRSCRLGLDFIYSDNESSWFMSMPAHVLFTCLLYVCVCLAPVQSHLDVVCEFDNFDSCGYFPVIDAQNLIGWVILSRDVTSNYTSE